MPELLQFNVLIHEDHGGGCTVSLLESFLTHSVHADSEAEALDDLNEYLAWMYKRDPYHSRPAFQEAKIIPVEARIRPEYYNAHRSDPCPELIRVTLPCVTGIEEERKTCVIPMLSIRFGYFDDDSMNELAAYYMKTELDGVEPRYLTSYLTVRSSRLETVRFNLRAGRAPQAGFDYANHLPEVSQVAEPVCEKSRGRKPGRAWERDAEAAALAERLRRSNACVILLGETGSGKSTLLAEAAAQVERGRKDQGPAPHLFWRSNGARIIAGMSYLGMWEERCECIVEELDDIDGFLCIENLLDLVSTGGRSATDSVAAFLVPYIERGELRMVAEATPVELDACRRLLPGLAEHFQIVTVEAMDQETACRVIGQVARSREQHLRVSTAEDAVGTVFRLHKRFLPYTVFPGRAVRFLDQLLQDTADAGEKSVSARDVVQRFVRETGLPEIFLDDFKPLDFEEVRAHFASRIIGQDAACDCAARVVMSFKAGLNDPERPLGVLLFTGPTGTGKTAMARSVADYFFGAGGDTRRMIRLDMSEYGNPGAAARLVSLPDGKPSELIQRIRRQPFAVVLLDEIEKADSEVFDLLLNVLDEGRLTDETGRLAIFRSAIIIMTSNLGATSRENLGFGENAPGFNEAVRKFFRPEFFNRIDETIAFNPLTPDDVRKIVELELNGLLKREGLSERGLHLEWDEAVLRQLGESSYDERYGARPLQRAIEREVVVLIARHLAGHPECRDKTFRLAVESGAIKLLEGES